MIHFYEDAPNFAAREKTADVIEASYDEVRQLLPMLPENLNIWLDNWCLIPETGDGGFAHSPDTMTIAFDLDFGDKESQRKKLRQTIFHEAFHLAQGHTREETRAVYETALDQAIYEGCATVFERQYAGAEPLGGNYKAHSDEQLEQWRDELAAIPYAEFVHESNTLWSDWSFTDSESGERWRLYKVGSWVVDHVLSTSGKDIINLQPLSAKQIRDLL